MKKKKVSNLIVFGIVLLNIIAIVLAIILGLQEKHISTFFQERQTVTFISAVQITLSSLFCLFIFLIKKRVNLESTKKNIFWLINSLVFLLAAIDEYFMLHEGIDGDIATFFFGIKKNPHLDGLTLALYGVTACILFFKFKQEIKKMKQFLPVFYFGGFFFFLSITLDLKSTNEIQIILEESCKLIAVGLLFSGILSIFVEITKKIDIKLKDGITAL